MRIEISKDVRIKIRENFLAIEGIEKRISARIRAEFQPEIDSLRAEAKALHEQDREFGKNAMEFIKANQVSKKRIVTQTGPNGGDILREHVGHVVSFDRHTFNFSSPDFLDGKEFTVGYSCLQSIENVD